MDDDEVQAHGSPVAFSNGTSDLEEKRRALHLVSLFAPTSKQMDLDAATITKTIEMFDLEGEAEVRQFLKIVLKMQVSRRAALVSFGNGSGACEPAACGEAHRYGIPATTDGPRRGSPCKC